MTDNEIIKALECCGCDNYQCDNCPYAYKTCTVYKDSLDLINRQKAEIERLRKKIEELSEVLSDSIRIRYKEAKSEAIKEFAERLKRYSCRLKDGHDMVDVICIDNFVKEMAGDNNAE